VPIPTAYAPMIDEYLARTGQSGNAQTDVMLPKLISGTSDTLTIHLPLCPTTNNLFLNVGRRRVKTKAYREWSDRAAFCLKDVPAWCGPYPVALDIAIVGGKGWTKACDVANREKACVDAIVGAGILEGDSCRYVTDVRVRCEDGADKALPAVMRVVIVAT
jgi:hypothetical protein